MMFEYYLLGLVAAIGGVGWIIAILSRKGKNDHKGPHAHQV